MVGQYPVPGPELQPLYEGGIIPPQFVNVKRTEEHGLIQDFINVQIVIIAENVVARYTTQLEALGDEVLPQVSFNFADLAVNGRFHENRLVLR